MKLDECLWTSIRTRVGLDYCSGFWHGLNHHVRDDLDPSSSRTSDEVMGVSAGIEAQLIRGL